MGTTLLLVRHGRTAWNKIERFRGQQDIPLDSFGQQQAEAVAQRIALEYHPAAVLSSPLKRARQTAEPIARACDLQVQIHQGLLDINYGQLAGLTLEEAERSFPALLQAWRQNPHLVHFPEGESLETVRKRVEGLLSFVRDHFAEREVVLVGHIVVCRVFLCALLGVPNSYFWRFHMDTASLSEFHFRGPHATLIRVNDTCHLASLEPSANGA